VIFLIKGERGTEMSNNWKIEISEELLLKRAGSGRSSKNERTREECQKAIEIGEKLLEPRVIYKSFQIDKIEEERVYLEGGSYFQSGHLAVLLEGADRIMVCCCTIGSALEKKVGELSNQGELMLAYFLDIYGATAVGVLGKSLYNQLQKELIGLGTTVPMEPGQLDWHVLDQRVLFQLLHPEEIGITLSDSLMMNPFKSISSVFGIGAPDQVKKGVISCSVCPKRDTCTFQQEAEEIMQEYC
jgi:hypothetical protein